MTDKFDYYDLLSVLVPGTLLVCWVPLCFPAVATLGPDTTFPDAFKVIALTALAIFIGHMVQAIASLLEPLMYLSWGGRPSDRALQGRLPQYLPVDSADRIKVKLSTAVGGNPSDHSLFLFAMQRSDAAGIGRATRFNGLYAYHRALLVLVLVAAALFAASIFWGAASNWGWRECMPLLAALSGLLVLIWHRAKQRGCYYAREVLLTAERVLDDKSPAQDKTTAPKG